MENYIFDSSLAHARLYRLDFVKKIHTGTPEKTDGGDGLPYCSGGEQQQGQYPKSSRSSSSDPYVITVKCSLMNWSLSNDSYVSLDSECIACMYVYYIIILYVCGIYMHVCDSIICVI